MACFAINLAPWYPRVFEFQSQEAVRLQFSRSVASSRGDFHRSLSATFVEGSLGVPYYQWYGEVGLGLAGSSDRKFGVDQGTICLRYQLLDDVSDVYPVSAVLSTSLSTVTKAALNDLSSFHHGKFEGTIQLAVGKELSYNQFWSSRFWGVFGVGIADVGSPWLHLKLCAEKNFCDQHRWSIYVEGLFGMGGNALSCRHFNGYGPIAHGSVDLWVMYRRDFDCGFYATIGGNYRVYAYNFPKNAVSGLISVLYPFAL